MLEDVMIPDKAVTTFAKVTTTEDIYFYGELADSYDVSFRKFKDNAGINELSPSLAFLADKGFSGYSEENYQKVDMIPYTPTHNL